MGQHRVTWPASEASVRPARPAMSRPSVRQSGRPSGRQFIVAPIVVLPVVRNVVSGREPSDVRAL